MNLNEPKCHKLFPKGASHEFQWDRESLKFTSHWRYGPLEYHLNKAILVIITVTSTPSLQNLPKIYVFPKYIFSP